MTIKVTLISPVLTAAAREARFDDGCPPDPVALRQARAAAGTLLSADRTVCSPTVRCRRTAAALALDGAGEPAALAPCAMGRWQGRTLAEVGAAEPEAVAAWLADPSAVPHGGESLVELCARVGGWLAATAELPGRVTAVVEPDVLRAALVHALDLPRPAFWRLDAPPLTAVELSGRAGRWNLRVGRPLTPAETRDDTGAAS
ncbi:phosphoglycerate mutase [Streptomyces albus subsp. albus]|nr:phosphoglycerate mutase [Streptomyces albus subsp. albus]